jgi:hypothetical protein
MDEILDMQQSNKLIDAHIDEAPITPNQDQTTLRCRVVKTLELV